MAITPLGYRLHTISASVIVRMSVSSRAACQAIDGCNNMHTITLALIDPTDCETGKILRVAGRGACASRHACDYAGLIAATWFGEVLWVAG